jgi:hypothetical protein
MSDANRSFTREQIEEYLSRDWEGASLAKVGYWAQRFREDWRQTWAAAQELREYATRVSEEPEFTRQEDLRAHIALRNRLDRVAHAFSNR